MLNRVVSKDFNVPEPLLESLRKTVGSVIFHSKSVCEDGSEEFCRDIFSVVARKVVRRLRSLEVTPYRLLSLVVDDSGPETLPTIFLVFSESERKISELFLFEIELFYELDEGTDYLVLDYEIDYVRILLREPVTVNDVRSLDADMLRKLFDLEPQREERHKDLSIPDFIPKF